MKNHTSIAVVLDRSGSMSYVAEDTVGGFNQFVESQKNSGSNADISLYQFDHEYTATYEGVPVSEAKPLIAGGTYCPRGSTALYDAVGRTINSLGARLSALPEDDRPENVIVVIITDGHENASREFTHQMVSDLIKQQSETYSWEFVFLGATLDAVNVATAMGIKATSSANYSYGKESQAFTVASRGVSKYRQSGASIKAGLDTVFEESDREELV